MAGNGGLDGWTAQSMVKGEERRIDDVMGHDFDENMSLVSNLSFVQFWDSLQRSSLRISFFIFGFSVSIHDRAICSIFFCFRITTYSGNSATHPRDNFNYRRLRPVRINGVLDSDN